ncbi:Solute carrier 7 member 3 [Cichlidogyrus casuarinus]|uniref:Solute carrier 7 member 3 n=1 Tax=Cichlidogyrus casuarinus TaxID=1844966 RepID=A0ABD2Q4J5_9PLAT
MDKQGKKKKETETESKRRGKLPPMKTASLVVKRVINDADVPSHLISVGYIDRFLGIIEKPFAAFCWDDYTSQDWYTFGVPEHRIQYFKYRKAVIWDKKQRLDNVFGSTQSGITIRDVIANYREEDYPQDTSQSATDAEVLQFTGYSEDEGDEEEELEITFDSANVCLGDLADEVHEGEWWQDKLRPNYFLCQKITEPEVIRNLSELQRHVIDQEPLYASCSQSPNLLHMTLCTLRLQSQKEIDELIALLEENKQELIDTMPKSKIQVKGVDRFFGRVLYAAVEKSGQLSGLCDALNAILRSQGFRVMDPFDFVPHISLIKVSRPVTRQLGFRNINPNLFRGFEKTHFGEFSIDTLHLCEMGQKRAEDGDYLKLASFQLRPC